ncbi:MobC family plasmid mobilization relaxosome protein [Nocardia nova]|uniref:MobC family plasmid mobilization relaxosome protein n=1 Tax=Nocardia nova TaxID=37330 RepID=UPI00372065CE
MRSVKVALSEEEFATLKAAAEEAGSTVPWYLVESTLNPPAATAKPGPKGMGKPWLPWPKRQALAYQLGTAARVLNDIRLEELSHVGANLNQLTRAANIDGVVGEELAEVIGDLSKLVAEIRERAEDIEAMAKEVVRR